MAGRRTAEELLEAERSKIARESARAQKEHAARVVRVAQLEKRAGEAKVRAAQLAARKADQAARQLVRAAGDERARDNQRKIIAGAIFLDLLDRLRDRAAGDPDNVVFAADYEWLHGELNTRVTGERERALFGLPPRLDLDPAAAL